MATTDEAPLLEVETFRRLRDETDDIDALFQLFVEERAVQVPALCAAAAAGSFTDIFALAHRLKGAALIMGVRRLIMRLLVIEQAAMARDRELCRTACEDLPALADASIAAVAKEI